MATTFEGTSSGSRKSPDLDRGSFYGRRLAVGHVDDSGRGDTEGDVICNKKIYMLK